MAVHKDASAVAYGAPEHGAEVMDLGASSMRPGAIDPMIRQRQSQATPLSCVDEAGPWGSWLARYLSPNGSDGRGVVPSLIPQQAGDRVTADRREAVPLARVARSGARTAGDVPHVDDDAMGPRPRAREAACCR